MLISKSQLMTYNLGSTAKHDVAVYKKKTSYKERKVLNFCKEILVIFTALTKHWMEKFELFDKFKQRVNVFLGTFLTEKIYYTVYDILKLVCSLWHGQSSVERVFSVNQEHLVENLLEEESSNSSSRSKWSHVSEQLDTNQYQHYEGSDGKYQIFQARLHGACFGREKKGRWCKIS